MSLEQDRLSCALEGIVANFAAVVRRVGGRYRLSAADVDELLQEVLIRLWRAHQGGEQGSEQIEQVSASYVHRTAASAAIDLFRRRRARRAEQAVSLEQGELAASEASDPTHAAEGSELAGQVARAIDAITPSRRPVVRMYLAGYSREEAAELMGWSEAKTRNLLYRGLADLRERLTEMGITCATWP